MKNPIEILKRLIGDARNAAQSLREIRAGVDNQSQQLHRGFSNLYASIDHQTKVIQNRSDAMVAAIDRLSAALAGLGAGVHGLESVPTTLAALEVAPVADLGAPLREPALELPPNEAKRLATLALHDRLIADIREIGHQPFIQIAISSPRGESFIHCATQEYLASFVDRLEKSEHFAQSSFLKGLSRALRTDFYGASEHFLDWIESDDELVRFEALDLSSLDHSLSYPLEFPVYHLLVSGSQGLDPDEFRSPSFRARSLAMVIHSYDRCRGNDSCRWTIIEGASLGLARYLASVGRAREAKDYVELALNYSPKSIHLRAAQHALGLRLDDKPIPARLMKFIGRDNGALRDVICPEPFRRFDISPSGEVLVCCGHWLSKPIGNLMVDEVGDIMNSESAKEIRASMLDGSYKYCNHLECSALIQDALPKKDNVTDAVMRRAIDHGDLTVDSVDQILFAFDQSCNLSCPSCRTHLIVEKPSLNTHKSEVVANKLMPLLSKLRKLDINPAGEAFFSKPSRRILEMVSKDTCPDLNIDLISNGMLLTEREWAKFPNLNGMVRSVRISTDASRRETFEKLRRLGVWETFVENARFLGRLRRGGEIRQLKFSFTYQVENFLEMREFVDFCRELSADFAIFERLQNLGAYSWQEFRSRAVHLAEHERHQEFLEQISHPLFGERDVWHDFEWEGIAERLRKPSFKGVADDEQFITQFAGS